MEQKIIQIGSSAGVTIPKKSLAELGAKVGDLVETGVSNGVFSVEPKASSSHIDPAVLTWTNKFIEKNRELLERLADK